MIRVLKPEGKIIIFDKFLPQDKSISFGKRVLRPIVSLFGTDIGVSFESLSQPLWRKISVEADIPVMFNGMYRKIILKRK